ncbi:type I secretion system permease/ATPase [Pseudaeromonas paramecii]|uniref:Type I secretion system permease/ATPase n=1 Tax=Pseudaeromonas paramecii TaxID=2138166 RepID=A0ABP8QI91_9GAMM
MESVQSDCDELLESLVFLSKFHGIPNSKEALVAGLPMPDGRLTPLLFLRAAERAGFTARQQGVSLGQISELLLPCVLLLSGGSACILLAVDRVHQEAEILLPASGNGQQRVPLAQLASDYSGQVLFVKKQFRYDARSPKVLETHHGHWFWSTLLISLPIYRDVLIASILINLFAIASPLFTMNVYDKIVPNLAFDSLWVLAVGVVIIFLFDFIMRQLRSYFIDIAGKKSDVLLSAKIFAKVMGIRMEARPPSTGAFAKHLQEFESIREFFTSATVSALIDLPFAFFFLLIIWIFAGNLVLVPFVAILVLALYSFYIQRPLRRSIEEGSRLASQKYANLVEGIAGLEAVKVFGAQGTFQYRWEQAVSHMANWGIETRKLTNRVSSLASFAQQMSTVGLIIMGVYEISEGNLTMGGMIAAVMLSSRAIAPMIQLSVLSTRYNQAKSAMSILGKIMESPSEQEEERQYIQHEVLSGRIEFEHVTFHYPEMEQASLREVNLSIRPGEKVAIIGRVGAGKSTLEKLLLGLYRPQSGAVRVDGYDLAQIHPAVLRRNIGCVPQDITLFFGSVRDNIIVGHPLVDDERVLRAARRGGVTQFTNQDPNGLARQVGEGGRLLSGGQRQAIALARALLMDPPLLILDEPTSNMDNRSESLVKQELARLGPQTTLLLITHRTTMLDVVDRLVVMEQGSIVADGPREQVLQLLKEGKIRVRGPEHE